MEDLETVLNSLAAPPIVATFAEGQTCVTVHGLHQWDYGATLEIRDSTLAGRYLEFHFAYPGAREAIVAGQAYLGGVCQVPIPNICLEQTAPVTVWVYETQVGQMTRTQGRTIRTVVLPIISRARPAALPTMPEEVSSLYTDVLTHARAALDEAWVSLQSATTAKTAAEQAKTAAEKAADDATAGLDRLAKLTQSIENGNVLPKASYEIFGTWVEARNEVSEPPMLPTIDDGLYAILAVPKTGMAVTPAEANFTAVVYFDGTPVYCSPGAWWSTGTNGTGFKVATLYVETIGTISLGVCWSGGNVAPEDVTANYDFYYKRIGDVEFPNIN